MPLQKVIGSLIEPNSIPVGKLPAGFPSWDPSGVIRTDTIQSNTTIVSSVSTNFGNANSFRLTNEQRIYSRTTAVGDVSYLTFNNTTKTIDNVIGQFNFALDGATMRPSAYAGVSTYSYTGANQTFTVPAGVKYVFAKLWGGGGGEGRQGSWTYGSDGGGGGHTRGIIPVTPGETLTLVVGQGGHTARFGAIYGGGGGATENSDIQYGGTGGGYAGIFRTGGTALTVDVLIVAGGGGGGMDMGGGGGGGGVLEYNNVVITPDVYSISVGAGGAGAPAAGTNGQPSRHQYTIPATKGGNSFALGYTAIGGGFGGSSYRGYSPGIAGGAGGSGGGSSGYNDNAGTFLGGLGTSGQGYRGGNSTAAYYAGGGGGAGGPGVDSTARPDGGPGKQSSILGTSYYWGGGGGGSGYSIGGGNGGLGGGGGGAVLTTTGGTGGINNGAPGGGGALGGPNTPGGNAGANTGGGGGGGSHYNANNKGGDGGSGIVIIRYAGAQQAIGGDTVYQTTINGQVYTIHQFTSARTSNFAFGPLLIAGGGGGGGSTLVWPRGQNGGAGGGRTGCTGDSLFDNKPTFAGTGGTQTAGGSAPAAGGVTVGTQLLGGNCNVNSYGGGGGGGWYGGGGGAYSERNTMAGGGGGSGYVHSSVILGDTFAGCERMPAFFWDSDLAQNTRNGGPIINAVGGRTNRNARPTGNPSGGNAYIVIYY